MATLKKMQKRMAKNNAERFNKMTLTPIQCGQIVENCFEGHLEMINKTNGGRKIWKRNWTWTSDLAIAMFFGKNAIEDTCDRALEYYHEDVDCMTEFVMSVNFMSWFCAADEKFEKFVGIFSDLYYDIAYERLPKLMKEEDYLQMMMDLN